MNLLAVVKEAINLLQHPVHWTMEKADIVTAIVNVTEKFAQETTNLLAQPGVRRIRRHARKSLAKIPTRATRVVSPRAWRTRGLRVSSSKHPARPVRRVHRAKAQNARHASTAENRMRASAGISQE
jgi:hypothetical protein